MWLMQVYFLLIFWLNNSMGSSSLHAWQYRSFSTIFPFDSTYKESDVTTEGFNEEVTLTVKLLAAIGPVILSLHSIRLKYHLSDFFGARGVLGVFSLVTSSRFLAYILQHHYHYLIYLGDSQYTPNAPFEQTFDPICKIFLFFITECDVITAKNKTSTPPDVITTVRTHGAVL
jgi:hypothetical protein